MFVQILSPFFRRDPPNKADGGAPKKFIVRVLFYQRLVVVVYKIEHHFKKLIDQIDIDIGSKDALYLPSQ